MVYLIFLGLSFVTGILLGAYLGYRYGRTADAIVQAARAAK